MSDQKYEVTNQSTAAQELLNASMQAVDVDGASLIADLTSGQTAYCSMTTTDQRSKAALFNATNSTQERIGDHINEVIEVLHLYVEAVQCTNRETGEVKWCPRVVLITPKGIGYQAVSTGIYSSVKKILQIFGEPGTWESPIKVKVKQLTKGEYKILTLEIAS